MAQEHRPARHWVLGRRAAALSIIVGLYLAARPPTIAAEERSSVASRFKFEEHNLPVAEGMPFRSVRAVHPSLAHISGWISAVGAAVALDDLDGDGLPNDVCHVDPRTDTVVVAPAPGSPQRYSPIVVTPGSLRYDAATMAPMGCLTGDLNEDGSTDLVIYYWGRTPILMTRRGTTYSPVEIVPGEERWYTNAATLADMDGDGHLDLVVANYFPDGSRILDAAAAGHESMQYSMSRAFNGGGTHLFLSRVSSKSENRTISFEEAVGALEEDVAHAWTLAVGAYDLDGDLLPEIYFANDFGPDRLLHNRSSSGHLRFARIEGRKRLDTPSSKVLGRDSFKGMGVDFGDIDGDGIVDIVVSNITTQYGLLESQFAFIGTGDTSAMLRGEAPYIERSEELGLSRSGWAWDVKLADFDNDGALEMIQATGFVRGATNRWPELQELATANDGLLATPGVWPRFTPGDDISGWQANPFYVRGARRFIDIASQIGLDKPEVTRGLATADVDGDGDLDLAVANQWDVSHLFTNACTDCGAFLGMHLGLPISGGQSPSVRGGHPSPGSPWRPAIGASVVVKLPSGRRLLGQIDGGNGHSGKRSHDLHFGLGRVDPGTPLDVEIHYRDREGRPTRELIQLRPGWHTISLGSVEGEGK